MFSAVQGSFNRFPNITGMAPNLTQVVSSIDFSSQPGYWSNNISADFWAAVFTGNIYLPVAGLWRFSLVSDDGSLLYIDGAIVINADGNHANVTTNSRRVNLTAGYHSIEVDYCNIGGMASLHLLWKGPNATTYSVRAHPCPKNKTQMQ
ncbi:hypothetical protein ABBQ32_009455 [Trebouxia sp. C0010 RCD-2024]